MTQPQTVADLRRLIDDIDRHLGELRRLLAEGEANREAMLKQAMALAWQEGGNIEIVRIKQ